MSCCCCSALQPLARALLYCFPLCPHVPSHNGSDSAADSPRSHVAATLSHHPPALHSTLLILSSETPESKQGWHTFWFGQSIVTVATLHKVLWLQKNDVCFEKGPVDAKWPSFYTDHHHAQAWCKAWNVLWLQISSPWGRWSSHSFEWYTPLKISFQPCPFTRTKQLFTSHLLASPEVEKCSLLN